MNRPSKIDQEAAKLQARIPDWPCRRSAYNREWTARHPDPDTGISVAGRDPEELIRRVEALQAKLSRDLDEPPS